MNIFFIHFFYFYIKVVKDIPTAEEAYNFFTLNYEPDPPSRIETVSRKRQKQRDQESGDEEEAEVEEDAEAEEENQDQHEYQVTSQYQ